MKTNILLVDDQPAKLLSYELILAELDENLVKTGSATEALQKLLTTDFAVVLIDVCMPELDGFELAKMIREHPRFEKVAIIFVSAVQVNELDLVKGYAAGAVDYVPVPVVPELLRAKVRVFVDLYRKTRQLEALNQELEQRVAERTVELENANQELERRVDTRTREREAALAQVHEMQKLESLGQLTGGVAHDFNNLLMAVITNLDLAKAQATNNPKLHRLLDGAIAGAERGATLTKRMLAFARRQELKPEIVDVAELVENMTEMLMRSLGPTIRIETEFPPNLPPVEADPNQLELALLNLALNARDAMPLGGLLKITSCGQVVGANEIPHLPAGRICLPVGQRHRLRHGRGDAQAGRRAVLHDQGTGERNRAGAFDDRRPGGPVRPNDAADQPGRPRYDGGALAAQVASGENRRPAGGRRGGRSQLRHR